MAVDVLTTADGREKTAKSRRYAAEWFAAREAGEMPEVGQAEAPLRPSRPEKPELLDPRDVPRRRPGSPQGRIALLHAVAHIELNAVDLHWDIIPRFAHVKMPPGFYDDWVRAADEESKHFNLMCTALKRRAVSTALCRRMRACGARPRRRSRISWGGWRLCPWCWRRAGST